MFTCNMKIFFYIKHLDVKHTQRTQSVLLQAVGFLHLGISRLIAFKLKVFVHINSAVYIYYVYIMHVYIS